MNSYYLLTILTIAAGAIPKGYDEGGFSAAVGLPSFKKDFHLLSSEWNHDPSGLTNRTANITSFGVLGAAFGSIIAIFLNDRLGRLRAYRVYVAVWAIGILMQIFSSGILGLMLFARIFGGLGAGGLTVCAPLFLSEIAPAKSRGFVVSAYMFILLSFLSLGFFINFATNKTMAATQMQYRLVMSIPLIPVGLAFISSFFVSESPRWLMVKGRSEEARSVLSKLRGLESIDPALEEEMDRMQAAIPPKDLDRVSTISLVKEIFRVRTYRNRFLLSTFMQTVAQWSGGNGITYYIVTIFQYAGVSGQNTSLLSSGAYGLVKLLFTVVFALVLIDILGRRFSMLSGITLQLLAHIYMGVYMAYPGASDNRTASNGAIASIFIYAVGWSIGLCTIQYLYGTEIFPTHIRSISYATNMGLHWFFQFAVVRVTPNMFVGLHVYGAFVFWAVICAIALVGLGLWAPETKGVSLEGMDELFQGKWYMGWKARVAEPAFVEDGLRSSNEEGLSDKEARVRQLERV